MCNFKIDNLLHCRIRNHKIHFTRAVYVHNDNLFMSDTTFLENFSGHIVDPVPVISFINRPHESQRLTTVPTMKEVDRLSTNLRSSFGDKHKQDDWYDHINKLTLDVFQKYVFNSMKCYFTIKSSLKDTAQRALYNLKSQLDTPKWADFMSSWFMVEVEDWVAIAKATPFCSFRYSLRCAFIYRFSITYFNLETPNKFSRNSGRRYRAIKRVCKIGY